MSKRNGSGEELTEHSVKKMKNEDNRLTYNSVPTLKQMAAVKIAIALWYHQNLRNLRPSLGYDWQSSVPENEISNKLSLLVLNCCRSLDLFPKIREEVEKYCDVIKQQMENWRVYQHKRIFFDYDEKQVAKYLNEIVWHPDGLIDYRKTAKHMLGSLNITGIEKYRIICTYCLEEEIGNVSYILVPLNNEYRERVVFESHPLIYYWNCKIRGEMNKITRGNFESVESRMLGSFYADNECAIQYFFNHLSPLEKLDKAKMLIRKYECKFQCLVLSQFNESEQREIFAELAPKIIVNFAEQLHYSGYALNTWIYVREFITENQCIEMWKSLLELTIYGNCNIVALVVDFWRNTSDDFKQCVLKNNFIIKNAITSSVEYFDENLEYFLEILSDASVELKKWAIYCDSTFYWFHHASMTCSDRSLMRKFINVCLPDPNDVAEFKTRLLDTYTADEHCWNLCEEGGVEKLDKFLALFLPDENAVDDYKEKLFMSHSTIIHFVHLLKEMDLDIFKTSIQKILSRNENAKRFMMKLITSNGALEKFHKWIFKGEFNQVKKCVEILLHDENDKNTVKQMLLYVYRDETIMKLFTKLDGNLCGEFLSFCLSNEENALQFKQTLPFHYIFQTMLKRTLLKNYDHGDCDDHEMKPAFDFIKLDAFLLWFFVTVENVKKYKIQQIYKFHRIDILVKDHIWPIDDALRKLVQWFFDHDAEEMQKFELSNTLTKL